MKNMEQTMREVAAPADAAGETPTKEEFNNLIQKLKDAKVFK